MLCIRDARAPPAAAGVRRERRRRWHTCVRCLGNRCDLIEVTAPSGFRLPLVAVIWVCPASPLTRGRRDVRGRPREQLSSHTSRGSEFAPPMCSVRSRTGHGHALRLVRLAARKLTAVARPLQGPFASARSCVPLRMRSITTGVSHLRSRSFIGPPSSDASVRCRRLRRAALVRLPSLANSDPKARSALCIRKGV